MLGTPNDPSTTPRPHRPSHAAPDNNVVKPRVPRSFLLLFTVLVGFAAALVVIPFWAPLFLGITLAATVFPFYQLACTWLPKRPFINAVLTTLGLLGVVVAPVLGVLGYAASQLREGITWVRGLLEADSMQKGLQHSPEFLQVAVQRILQLFDLDVPQLRRYIDEGMDAGRDWLPQLFSMSVMALATLVMTLVICCIFLVQGRTVKELMLECLPLKRDDADKMLHDLRHVSTASFLGLGCTAMSHSLVIAGAFWLAGIPHATFFAILALLAAFAPVVSSALLYAPVALIVGLTHGPWPGIALFMGCLVGTQVLSNLLKPIAQKGRMPLNGALGFLSVLGGLTLFGLMGTIMGPMAMVAATSVFRVYRRDYLGGGARVQVSV